MTYQPPPKPAEIKPRYVEVTDAGEIAAIKRNEYGDPIGHVSCGKWYAETRSLRQYRERITLADGGRQE